MLFLLNFLIVIVITSTTPLSSLRNTAFCYVEISNTSLNSSEDISSTTSSEEISTSLNSGLYTACATGSAEFKMKYCQTTTQKSQCLEGSQQQLPQCPSGFTESLHLCYIITEKMGFPPKCPYEDTVPFDHYQYLLPIAKEPVWLPVTRDLDNGIGFLKWYEASERYKKNFADNYYASPPFAKKNCLVYRNDSYTELVFCDEKYAAICAYSKLNSARNRLCDYKTDKKNCIQSNYNVDSNCFCAGSPNDIGSVKIVEFLQPYQNQLYSKLTSDQCLIGLEKTSDGKFVWKSSNIEVNYSYWAPTAICDNTHRFGAISPDGWLLLENEDLSCFLYEEKTYQLTPELELTKKGDKTLKLVVNNFKALKWVDVETSDLFVYCFTDSTPYSLVYRYEQLTINHLNSEEDKVSYSFSVSVHGPGNYWCESLQYPQMQIIRSNTVFMSQEADFDVEFVSVINMGYVPGTDPLNPKISANFLELVLYIKLSEIEHFKTYYTVRLMKILSVDEDHCTISINVHLTSKKQSTIPNLVDEYNNMKTIINNALNEINSAEIMKITLETLKYAQFCPEETTEEFGVKLIWPQTMRGEIARPKNQYCFTSGATQITRLCGGDFIDGATWSEITERCEIPLTSSITDELIDLLDENDSSIIIDDILNITTRYTELGSFDVYLISQLFEKIRSDSTIDLEELAQIINNLHQVNFGTLEESQWKMNATDRILHFVDEIIYGNQNNVTIQTANFGIITSNTKHIKGIILENLDGTIKVTLLEEDIPINDLVANTNLDSALLLNSNLINQFQDSKVAITLFFKNSLFNDKDSSFRYISKIFGVLLPDSQNFEGPITIVHRLPSKQLEKQDDHDCAFWNYGRLQNNSNIQGSWKTDTCGLRNFTLFSLCEYYHTTHFALLLVDNIDDIEKWNATQILDIMTLVNSGLSLFGLVGILITAFSYKRWRQNTGNQILVNFVFAITLQIATFYVSNEVFENSSSRLACTIVGIILHYSLISQFCWMFIIAVLQFKRFVDVLGGPPKYILLKACLCGWILPLLPVGCVFGLDRDNYNSGKVGLCYPSGLGLYLGVWLPIAIVVVINFVVYLYIIYNVVHKKTECVEVSNSDKLFQWRLAILLFFMLGLTWGFGLLAELEFGIIFIYLFCFTATLQGFVMFLFFIVFNKNTRYLYYHSLKTLCKSQQYY